jgi:hypothetical protein
VEDVIVVLAFRRWFSKDIPNIALVKSMLSPLSILFDSHDSSRYNMYAPHDRNNGESSVSVLAAVVSFSSVLVY